LNTPAITLPLLVLLSLDAPRTFTFDAHDDHHASLEVGRWRLDSHWRCEEESLGSCGTHNVGNSQKQGNDGWRGEHGRWRGGGDRASSNTHGGLHDN
jgi:hypothetical protein